MTPLRHYETPLRQTPFHARTAPLNRLNRWGPWAGCQSALCFGDVDMEYTAIRNAATVYDLCAMIKYRVTGPDAAAYQPADSAQCRETGGGWYATGMRRTEIASLQVGDVEPERGVVLIREGKGGKDRLLPIGERALYWLTQYLEQARPQIAWNADDKTLFLGREGKPMNPVWLSTVIAKRVDAAKIGKRGGCHLWRHTMATLMLEGGADIRFIQAMLGHAEISTTQIYTQVAIRQLQAVHALTHPGQRGHQQSDATDAQNGADMPAPQLDEKNAADALLAALDAEAEEEAQADRER